MSRTLFIHIPKTAGTSIGKSDHLTTTRNIGIKRSIRHQMEMDPVGPHTLHPLWAERMQKHIPYSYLDNTYINRFDRVFTVVRNPWARVVSFYNYVNIFTKRDSYIKHMSKTWYNQQHISWEEYLDRMDTFIMTPNFYWQHPYDHWASQSDWLPSKGKVDILRFENLNLDLNQYFGKEIVIPTLNSGPAVDYRTCYTEDQIQRVADWFKVDIARWGFSFDSGATKDYWLDDVY